MNEEELIEKYCKIKREFDNICFEVSQYFMPLAKQAIEKGDIEEAREIMLRCPDIVTSAFILDAIQNYNPNAELPECDDQCFCQHGERFENCDICNPELRGK